MKKHFSYENGKLLFMGNPVKPNYDKQRCSYYICIEGKPVYLHRLVWEITKGPIPKGKCVIAKDGDYKNFSPDNLILHKHGFMPYAKEKHHYTKLKGAHFAKGLWRARINKDGKQVFLGSFSTAEEAHAAYMKAKNQK